MTFDDGILTIYRTVNTAEPGNKPNMELTKKGRYCFGYAELGFSRVYAAMQAKQQVDLVVNIPEWEDVRATDICEMEDGQQYRIGLVQPTHDEDGLKILKLSLERRDGAYAVKT